MNKLIASYSEITAYKAVYLESPDKIQQSTPFQSY
jgi:hypothetical protein